jgi:hypothetical protein
MDPATREIAWGLLGMGVTALVFWGAAGSYPQGHDTIWAVGGVTMAAVATLAGREVARSGRRGTPDDPPPPA